MGTRRCLKERSSGCEERGGSPVPPAQPLPVLCTSELPRVPSFGSVLFQVPPCSDLGTWKGPVPDSPAPFCKQNQTKQARRAELRMSDRLRFPCCPLKCSLGTKMGWVVLPPLPTPRRVKESPIPNPMRTPGPREAGFAVSQADLSQTLLS